MHAPGKSSQTPFGLKSLSFLTPILHLRRILSNYNQLTWRIQFPTLTMVIPVVTLWVGKKLQPTVFTFHTILGLKAAFGHHFFPNETLTSAKDELLRIYILLCILQAYSSNNQSTEGKELKASLIIPVTTRLHNGGSLRYRHNFRNNEKT